MINSVDLTTSLIGEGRTVVKEEYDVCLLRVINPVFIYAYLEIFGTTRVVAA